MAVLLLTGAAAAGWAAPEDQDLARGFAQPPPEARPWVYWFWLNGNITRQGITADLEAMQRVGIGGALIMEVDQGAPVGPVDFMSDSWRELFRHVHAEARRLGLEINMNDDAGWNGSGGPWIKPEQSMQEVTWAETNLTGPLHFEGPLQLPTVVAGFYRDIAVQAFPAVGDYRIPSIISKGAFQTQGRHAAGQGELTPAAAVSSGALTNLSGHLDAEGRLTWDVPPGRWTVVRYGHTSTGVENAPAPLTGRGLECDKLSPEGIRAHFTAMMQKLAQDTGVATAPSSAGLVATHIDSWENGSQNWTARMPEFFRARRGYDLIPYLPVLTGRVVDSLEISERFLWDLRRTVSELVIENYAGEFRRLAHQHGLRFTVEAYGSPCDAIPYGGQSDEPMGEFWTPGGGAMDTCRGMASAGHVYGKRIIGAEAFTSADQERWREHPAVLKALGDQAFCEGINRFVFHRYAMQPWVDYRPGMTMGPWGQHYERTQTWWDWTPAWHEYLARCQFLLRQGHFVADLLYLQTEASPQGFGRHPHAGYEWDECTAHAVLTRLTVRDGRLVLPDGLSYRLLVLPETRTMTPELLRKLHQLVREGATLLGPRPLHSPSLTQYPPCDQEIDRLGRELWGDCDGNQIQQHTFGQGRVVWGPTPEQFLQRQGLPPDFAAGQPFRHLHRQTDQADLYFVANAQPLPATATCSFRVTGRIPELWHPETGQIEPAAVYRIDDQQTHLALTLQSSGSVFVVFRQPARDADPIVQVRRDGTPILSADPPPPVPIEVREARYGVLDDPQRTRDVTAKVQAKVDAGDHSFRVSDLAQGDDPAFRVVKTLVVDYQIGDQSFTVQARDPELIHLGSSAVKVRIESARYGVLEDPQRTRDVRDRIQRLLDAGVSSFPVARMAEGDDPAFLVVKTLVVDYVRDGQRLRLTGTDPETVSFTPATVPSFSPVQVRGDRPGPLVWEAEQAATYEFVTASGATRRVQIKDIPPPLHLTGPWNVQFDPRWGGPGEVLFEQLGDWSKRPEEGIRFYSGHAIYRTRFVWNPARTDAHPAPGVYLDLGQVAVMAEVTLNGHRLGTLWKPPFRLEVTDLLRPGENDLEVKVINLWINRMIGDEQLPEDSARNPNGTLKHWPQWVREGKPSPTGRFTFTSWRLWKKDDSLAPSGLLGPVQLQFRPRRLHGGH